MTEVAVSSRGRSASDGAGPAAGAPVTVYGTSWCAATQIVRRHLDRQNVTYRYVDLDLSPPALAHIEWMTGGYASHPTIDIAGEMLVEPSLCELDGALNRLRPL
jgi:mycoredoxin